MITLPSQSEVERLTLLVEECGEVIQAATKILRHGYASCYPDSGVNNRVQLEKEIGDVVAIIDMLAHNKDVNALALTDAADNKLTRLPKWTRFQSPENFPPAVDARL